MAQFQAFCDETDKHGGQPLTLTDVVNTRQEAERAADEHRRQTGHQSIIIQEIIVN